VLESLFWLFCLLFRNSFENCVVHGEIQYIHVFSMQWLQVQVVDGTCPQAVEEYEAIRLELQLFNPELAEKPFVVAYNKMDTQEAADQWPSFQEALEKKGVKAFCMSAATQQGTMPVVWAAFELLQSQKKAPLEGLISFFRFVSQFFYRSYFIEEFMNVAYDDHLHIQLSPRMTRT